VYKIIDINRDHQINMALDEKHDNILLIYSILANNLV